MTGGVASAGHRPISLFSVYAPEDVSFHEYLEKHLSSLKRQGLISLWSVDKILPGADRNVEIERNLYTAQIILLLLSADFLASEHCDDVMMRALQRQKADHVRVIPILLRPIDRGRLSMSELQVLPANGKSVTTWLNCDEAFSQIAEAIRKMVVALLNLPADMRTIAETHLSYLHWLIKRTSYLDTRGISPTQHPSKINLEEVYIPLQARHEEGLQAIGSTPFSKALETETSIEIRGNP